ncbi:pyridoxamine 5'-phosphate oxidase family protein [Pseudonocardia humida]|uniref:Pyridoxamine 5'-phosphate oxidase family protein n=1 Tax=Pseudonocardia humida TaxID=2800819 RepID=A0ABT1ABJ1_9PSEU|nr:pyridoxamine 5'-phosphate oxidase family protein [Pseudonocardia humida]MCO1660397.1 pyridoxamine 5'-phosphate oxidase family protein [Pseudonocardia humida]
MPEPLEPDAMAVLSRWVAEAGAAGLPLPSTMTLATTGPDGPHARTVLVTAVDAESVRFHSSTPTGKTVDLDADPRASGVFHWPALGRQATLTGRAAQLDAAVSRAAFPTRPRQLQLVAWAYEELLPGLSGPVYGVAPDAVRAAFDAAATRESSAAAPPSWTTIALVPHRLDFWQAGTETTPPTKTRYDRTPTGWTSTPVLP